MERKIHFIYDIADRKQLFKGLTRSGLKAVENILKSHFTYKIGLDIPRLEKNGKVDLNGIYEEELERDFERWDNLYKNGGTDLFWSDGINLNLVRNHILSDKSRIEKEYTDRKYPEIYYRDTPHLKIYFKCRNMNA